MAEHTLFYKDNSDFFAMTRLRGMATEVVRDSSLIRRCEAGDRRAAEALFPGFWYFVDRFEKAIDARKLSREPLYAKFGVAATRSKFLSTAHAIRQLKAEEFNGVFQSAEEVVREMQQEEATHAAHWVKDAENLGINYTQLETARVVPGVKALVAGAYDDDLVKFFAVLAGTEFIAEELSVRLAHAPLFTRLFRRLRAIWMEVHTIPHDHGPSHLYIDMDLARAYSPVDADAGHIEDMVLETIHLFGHAADEVEAAFAPRLVPAE